ncbi:MAG TPA: zinc ABC transporter substrate-binding protein, partial [Clostridiales bacterium]|nr:zinc ABC transporter substrate-binding protein [Clostridiales bacterium]
MRLKRILFMLLACFTLTACFSACGRAQLPASEELSVVAANFPAYDFSRQVLGNAGQVTMLLPPGSESHSYEPTAQDILKIQGCDLFVYTGGESDAWVDKILNSLGREINTLKMMDCVSVLEEEDGHEPDEHVWTSPVNAIRITEEIRNRLCEID